VGRPRHPHKEIEATVAYAEGLGWRWEELTGHGWGKLLCPYADRDGCQVFVYSTPRNPEGAARGYKRSVDRCECVKKENCDEGA
jgi:hypothetical protein